MRDPCSMGWVCGLSQPLAVRAGHGCGEGAQRSGTLNVFWQPCYYHIVIGSETAQGGNSQGLVSAGPCV
jgi:hypothetical protein